MVRDQPPVYSEDELNPVISKITIGQSQTLEIKREWTRYWVLRYLEKEKIKVLDALVLTKGRRTYNLLISDYLLEASMPREEGRGLNPGDHFRVEVVQVNAREEVLKLRMA
jgi:exoribonuclease-2